MAITTDINRLISYGIAYGLMAHDDVDDVANKLLDLLQVDYFSYEKTEEVPGDLDQILGALLNHAKSIGLLETNTIDERDLLDTKIMGCLMPRASEVNAEFERSYQSDPKQATNYFYKLSLASNYIRKSRIKKDKRWKVKTNYGELDMTINLSKPEKDPKTIALAKQMPSSGYPKCVLCKENVGFSGNLSHPARQNHRIIPVTLKDENWYLQYSPYVYYGEHCIVLKGEHEPMEISRLTFERLLAFVEQFKHYFVGSNADLPIVGGSILTHDHFQGGAYTFAMNDAKVLKTFELPEFPDVNIELLNWPLTTLRLKGDDVGQLVNLADHVLKTWRTHSDPLCDIYATTDGVPHNTVTPIARFKEGNYELDLVLRNNRTSDEHPDGIFHPHEQYHHLKKENIGLIEVMGLAVLPGRLVAEFDVLTRALLAEDVDILLEAKLDKHQAWFLELMKRSKGLDEMKIKALIEQDVGLKFAEILACCGVYKLDESGLAGVNRFMEVL